jgi:hypothetical protein
MIRYVNVHGEQIFSPGDASVVRMVRVALLLVRDASAVNPE